MGFGLAREESADNQSVSIVKRGWFARANGRGRLRHAAVLLIGVAVLLAVFPTTSGGAQSPSVPYSKQAVDIGPPQLVQADLYRPTGQSPNGSTALVVAHQIPVSEEVPCLEMAQLGFTVVCTQETGVTWDQLARGIGYGVTYARSLASVRHVVLLGWSGGGSMVAYYENVAENGVSVCDGQARLDPCGHSLAGLPRADGVVFLDAIPGLAFSFMSALDASTGKADGLSGEQNRSLYLFNPGNGYNPNPNESSNYSSSFIHRYTQAQGQRESALIKEAQHLVKGGADTQSFSVGREAARIWQQDTSLLSHTKDRHLLITPSSPEGSVRSIRSVRVPSDSPVPSSPSANDAAPTTFTAGTFLSTSAIKTSHYRLTADSIEGVDWASSNTSTVTNVQGITAPLLIMSMSAHYWVVPSEMYYDAAKKSKSKTLAYVYGAMHTFNPCMVCGSSPTQFGDTVSEVFDYVSNWLGDRYRS